MRDETARMNFCTSTILYSPECVEVEFSEVRQDVSYDLYLFQNAGDSSTSTVKISSLPSSMHTVSTTRPKGLTISKLSVAPTCPRPGPTSLSVVATAVSEEVRVSSSWRATRKHARLKVTIQAAKRLSTAILVPSGTTRPPTCRGVTARGCTILKTSCTIVRKTIRIRITFMPPRRRAGTASD